MTNFLERLVARARGTIPRVEPVIAPVFASESPLEIGATPAAQAATSPPTGTTEVVRQNAPTESIAPKKTIEVVRETLLVPLQSGQETGARFFGQGLPPNSSKGTAPAGVESSAVAEKIPQVRPAILRAPASRQSQRGEKISRKELAAERPVVRVTIGRIDVRAAPAPAAPARKVREENRPRLTLDDYLQQRKKGAR
jgi:hypothetical protein